jgi:hypothetical protein
MLMYTNNIKLDTLCEPGIKSTVYILFPFKFETEPYFTVYAMF